MTHRPHDAAQWDAVENAAELLRERDYDEALRELGAALDRDPRNPYAHYFTGAALFERGEFESARVSYAAALDHAPDYLGAIVGLGHCLRRLTRFDEAITAAQRALTVAEAQRVGVPVDPTTRPGAVTAASDQEDPDVHYLLGMIYADRGDVPRARRHLEVVLASRPEVELEYEIRATLDALEGRIRGLDET